MGICSSCLGRNRHPSQQAENETDPLLSDADAVRYGADQQHEVVQPDEEELRREREVLSRITIYATESMIDVLHPNTVDVSTHLAANGSLRKNNGHIRSDSAETNEGDAAADAEEQAWLDSVQSAEISLIKPLQRGALVIDIGLLREHNPPSSAKKALRGVAGRM